MQTVDAFVAACVLVSFHNLGGLSFPAPAGMAGAAPGAGGQLQAGHPAGKQCADLGRILKNTSAGQALEKVQASPGQAEAC